MMRILKTITVIVAISLVSICYSDSILNIDNYGEPVDPLSARLIAMGFVNVGLFDGRGFSHINPSAPSCSQSTVFTTTFYRNESTYNLGGVRSSRVIYNLPCITFDINLPFGGVLSFSYLNRYDWGYKVSKPIMEGEEKIGTAYGYGDGGVSTYSAGYSIDITRLLVGGAIDYWYGDPKYIWTKEFTKDGYSDVRDVIEHRIKGVGFRLGAGFNSEKVDVGFYLRYPLECDMDRVISNVEGEIAEEDTSIRYPVVLGFGVSVKPVNTLTVGFDLINSRWAGFKIGGHTDGRLRNTTEYRLGIEFQPPLLKKRFILLRLPARFGYYYRPWYSLGADGARYSENGITFGTGLMFIENENSSIDVAFQVGWRDGGELKENIYRLYLTFNGIEKWLGKYIEED